MLQSFDYSPLHGASLELQQLSAINAQHNNLQHLQHAHRITGPQNSMKPQQLHQSTQSYNQNFKPQQLNQSGRKGSSSNAQAQLPWFDYHNSPNFGVMAGFASPIDQMDRAAAWDMEGLTLPVGVDKYQIPVEEVMTMQVEATMDVADKVVLDTPDGPQEVEMFNIAPRVEPSPVFEGRQVFDPWHADDFMNAAEPFLYDREIGSGIQMEEQYVAPAQFNFGTTQLDQKDKTVKAKIVKKFDKLPFLGPELQSERIKQAITSKYLLVKKGSKLEETSNNSHVQDIANAAHTAAQSIQQAAGKAVNNIRASFHKEELDAQLQQDFDHLKCRAIQDSQIDVAEKMTDCAAQPQCHWFGGNLGCLLVSVEGPMVYPVEMNQQKTEDHIEKIAKHLESHEDKVKIVRDKIAKKLHETDKHVNSALEKQKELNKKLISKLKQAKNALETKAQTAKELATKAKKAVEFAKSSEGELKQKLHNAASKVAQKAKTAAQEVKMEAEIHAKEVEAHLQDKINEAKKIVKEAEQVTKQHELNKKKAKKPKSLLEMIDDDEFMDDMELDDLFNSEFEGLEDLFDEEIEEIDEDYLALEDLADAELIGFDDEDLEALLAEELLMNVMII